MLAGSIRGRRRRVAALHKKFLLQAAIVTAYRIINNMMTSPATYGKSEETVCSWSPRKHFVRSFMDRRRRLAALRQEFLQQAEFVTAHHASWIRTRGLKE